MKKPQPKSSSAASAKIREVKGWYVVKPSGSYHFTSCTFRKDVYEILNKKKLNRATLLIHEKERGEVG